MEPFKKEKTVCRSPVLLAEGWFNIREHHKIQGKHHIMSVTKQ